MRILAIETSCDETSAAIVEKIDDQTVRVLSNITATSLALHATTGGIIPENAAREQVKYIMPVIRQALNESRSKNQESWENANEILKDDIDAIAVTYGPGLIGSLLIGVETVKTLSFAFNKPIIPVNHLLAHLFANFINPEVSLREVPLSGTTKQSKQRTLRGSLSNNITFPFIGLIVSGGHTDLLLFESLTNYKWLGGTRDDAAGEALDKIGRLLNLPYPAGPEIELRSNRFSDNHKSSSPLKGEGWGEGGKFKFQSPMLNSGDFDFSFSGLKAEVSRFVQAQNDNKLLTDELTDHICSAVQEAIFKVLIKKTVQAAKKYECSTILLGGGVSANQTLAEQLKLDAKRYLLNAKVLAPERKYSTDNAAMIGAYAALNPIEKGWKKINSQPDLYFD